MLWVKVRCPAISLISSSIDGSRSLNFSLCGRSGAGLTSFFVVRAGRFAVLLAGRGLLRAWRAPWPGTAPAGRRPRVRRAAAARTGWTADGLPTRLPERRSWAVGGDSGAGDGGQSSRSGQSFVDRPAGLLVEVGLGPDRRPAERRDRLGYPPCPGRRVVDGGRRRLEFEPEVLVGIRIGRGARRGVDGRGRDRRRPGGNRGGDGRRPTEQIEERRVDVQRRVHRCRRAAGPAAAPGRRRPRRVRERRRVPRRCSSANSRRRVAVRSHTVTLPARRVRVRAGLPVRCGSGHAPAPGVRTAKPVIPTPPEPGCEWRQVLDRAARRPARGCGASR